MRERDTTRKAEQIRIEALRRIWPEGRLRASIDLARASRDLLFEGLRKRNPEFDENQIKMAYLQLVLPRDLFLVAYQYGTDIALLTENQTSKIMGNDPEVNRKHYGGVIDSEVRKRIENLPFDYRDISPSDDVATTKEGRREHLRIV